MVGGPPISEVQHSPLLPGPRAARRPGRLPPRHEAHVGGAPARRRQPAEALARADDGQPVRRRPQRRGDHLARAVQLRHHGNGGQLRLRRPPQPHPGDRRDHGCQHRHHHDRLDRLPARLQGVDRRLRPAGRRHWHRPRLHAGRQDQALGRGSPRLRSALPRHRPAQGRHPASRPGAALVRAGARRPRLLVGADLRRRRHRADGDTPVELRDDDPYADHVGVGLAALRGGGGDDPRREHRHHRHRQPGGDRDAGGGGPPGGGGARGETVRGAVGGGRGPSSTSTCCLSPTRSSRAIPPPQGQAPQA